MVKNLPAVQETQFQSLGWEDSLEKRMATHSSILAWSIPLAEEPGRLQSMWSQRVSHDSATNTFTFHIQLRCQYPMTIEGAVPVRGEIYHTGGRKVIMIH